VKIHEYQGKAILARFGVPVPRGDVAFNADESVAIAQRLGLPVVVKAQIHAGGRGKGGGVKVARTMEEVQQLAGSILGMTLVTHQTGPEGKVVQRLLIEQGLTIARELYLGLVIDRATGRPVLMASPAGGMEIEKVAAETPELIFKEFIHPTAGLEAFQAQKLAFALGLEGPAVKQAVKLMTAIYEAFKATDASMIEINPFCVLKDGSLKLLDAKMAFDGNAIYRHPDIAALRDETEEDPKELDAANNDLNYVALDGEIGCMVNGAGLAMATMDIIKLYGSSPANFLDVGGTANAARVTEAFRIITSDANVKAILVNIFGGIAKCDMIATGIVEASKNLSLSVPLVVRLEGTNVDLGKKILAESGLAIIPADNLADAAQKVVAAVNAARASGATKKGA
jgi:succinyl-CoA synthetase beta subunit